MGKKVSTKRNPLLELCPFCGEPGEIEYDSELKKYSVKCSNENCKFRPLSKAVFETEERAIKSWNTRIGANI